MKIGIDLDHVTYGHPVFFRALIHLFHAAGHEIYCTSNHTRTQWENEDRTRLKKLGIDSDLIHACLLTDNPKARGPREKARKADQVDLVFDDDADHFQKYTRTPCLKVPRGKHLKGITGQ